MSFINQFERVCFQSLVLKDSAVFRGTAEFRNKVIFGRGSSICGDLVLTGDLKLTGDTTFCGDLTLTGNQTVGGNQTVNGNQKVDGNSTVCGDLNAQANANVSGEVCAGSLKVTGDSEMQGNLQVDGDVTIDGVLCPATLDTRQKIVLDGTEDPFHGWWLRTTKGSAGVWDVPTNGPVSSLMHIDCANKKPGDPFTVTLYWGPVTDIREGVPGIDVFLQYPATFQRSDAYFFQEGTSLDFAFDGISDVSTKPPADPNSLLLIDEPEGGFGNTTMTGAMTLQESGELVAYQYRSSFDARALPFINSFDFIGFQDTGNVNVPFTDFTTNQRIKSTPDQAHWFKKLESHQVPHIRPKCDSSEKRKTYDPRYMLDYIWECWMRDSHGHIAPDMEDETFIGTVPAEGVRDTIRDVGTTHIIDIEGFQTSANMGVLGTAVTTVHTKVHHHVNPGSRVTLSGLGGAVGDWSTLNNQSYRVSVLNCSHNVAPNALFEDVDPGVPANSGVKHTFCIELDTSDAGDFPRADGWYAPPAGGKSTVNHGPITVNSEYRETVTALIEMYHAIFGAGGTHSGIGAYAPFDSKPYLPFIYDTWAEVQAAFTSGQAQFLGLNARNPGPIGSYLYSNPYLMSFDNLASDWNVRPEDVTTFKEPDVNDRFGFLPAADATRADYDYNLIVDNYLEEAAVLLYQLDKTSPAPSTPAEFATSYMYAPGDLKWGKLCGKAVPYYEPTSSSEFIENVGSYIDTSGGPPVARPLELRSMFVSAAALNNITNGPLNGKGGEQSIGPFGQQLGTPLETAAVSDRVYRERNNHYFGRIKKSLLGVNKNIGYIRLGDMNWGDFFQMGYYEGTGPVGAENSPKWAREGASKIVSAMMCYLLDDLECTDGMILDIRGNNGGSVVAIILAEFFGADRPGLQSVKAKCDEGSTETFPLASAETLEDVIACGALTNELMYVSTNEQLYNCVYKNAPLMILTDRQSVSMGDVTPHLFLGANLDKDIGAGVQVKILGDIDGRLFGGADGANPLPTSESAPALIGAVVSGSPNSFVTSAEPGLLVPFQAQRGTFGVNLLQTGAVTGDLVAVNPVTANDADLPFINLGDIAGKIALVERGGGPFDAKVLNVQLAGAIAVIVYDQQFQATLTTMGGSINTTIPSVFIHRQSGLDLIEALTGGSNDLTMQTPFVVTVDNLQGAPVSGLTFGQESWGNGSWKHAAGGPGLNQRTGLVEIDAATYPGAQVGLAGGPPLAPNYANTVHPDLGLVGPHPRLAEKLPGWTAGTPDGQPTFACPDTWRDSWLEHAINEACELAGE
jgi:cytoskeletal protein CcmA (bactofilin family)